MPKLQVFLSHLNVEAKFADTLKAHLSRDFIGLVDLFVSSDATSIPVGTHWLDQVIEAIKTASLHVVLCSEQSVRRPWINYEAGAAQLQGVPLLPLCHSGVTPEKLPVPLSLSEGAVLTDPRGIERLYRRIAGLLQSNLPAVDFQEYADEFSALESEYATQQASSVAIVRSAEPESISNPRVACVSSPQFLELGFKNQIQLVLDAFPTHLQHHQLLNSAELSKLLMSERVAIVHIAAYVCPRSGELYFSEVDPKTGESNSDTPDVMSADGFAHLLRMAGTRLAVISSCDSLALATTLLPVTNVIAPRDMVSARAMAVWLETFYRALQSQPLGDACDLAGKVSGAPMLLIGQQPNVVFARKASASAPGLTLTASPVP